MSELWAATLKAADATDFLSSQTHIIVKDEENAGNLWQNIMNSKIFFSEKPLYTLLGKLHSIHEYKQALINTFI